MAKKIPLVELIRHAEEVHGKGRYDYSLINEENYKDTHTNVDIKCNVCGDIFPQSFNSHISNKEGCPNCSGHKRITTESFIQKSRKIHGDKYDYSKVEYIEAHTPVTIICPYHGEFLQAPCNHLQGQECFECARIKRNRKNSLGKEEFIRRANLIHENKYDYSKVNYINNRTEVIIICPYHGEFPQAPDSHLQGCGCPTCRASKGEKEVANLLESKNIKFITEYRFNDCRDKYPLPFDFYLPDYNTCIEFDGEQHYREVKSWGGKNRLSYIQSHDNIKTNYCKQNSIPLLRIRFDENIETKLNQFLYNKCKIEPQSIFDL